MEPSVIPTGNAVKQSSVVIPWFLVLLQMQRQKRCVGS